MRKIDPSDFGLDLSREQFRNIIYSLFEKEYRFSVDELLLHPREAILFCDKVSAAMASFDISDDTVLSSLMSQRKHGPK